MICRHNRCIGIRLFRWKRWQLEIWFAPKGEVIERHVHRRIDSTIIMLAGGMWGSIGERIGYVGWEDIGRRFPIPHGVAHGATVNKFCLFANLEHWTHNVTSAAEDFVDA